MASKSRFGTMGLEQLRELIRTTEAKLAALDLAPLPLDEAEAALVAGVDRLASLYDPDRVLASFTRPGGEDIGTVQLLLPDAPYDAQRAAAYECSVHRDALLTALRARLHAIYAADPELSRAAVPMADRPARLEALRETVRDLALQEEALIVEAERRGQVIDRRADCDPAVLFAPEVAR